MIHNKSILKHGWKIVPACFFVLIGLVSCSTETKEVIIVPEPVEIDYHKGSVTLTKDTRLLLDESSKEALNIANILNDEIQGRLGFKLEIPAENKDQFTMNIIKFSVQEELKGELKEEGYKLNVTNAGIDITAATYHGIFYGVQTLKQLLPLKGEKATIPCLAITDYPRFQYRGMHLDVCRHFFDKDFVKKYIDFIAMHKMNKFHWHLTEDQGWRIEIKKYPKLTEIGAWRTEKDGTKYGGFFTQEDVKEIVEYAAQRYITVIPEIELPGHSLGALAAYPQYSCTGGPFKVANEWGVFHDVYCAGKDETFEFLQDIISEVIELFPSEYIHIGGDESPKTRWKVCKDCQKRIKKEGLKDEHELQSYFISRMEKFLISKNRQLIGWDEILEGGLAPEATVMSWRGIAGGIEAAKQGHDAIMTPGTHCYFDHYQGDPDIEPKAIGGFTDVEKVYSYEPIPKKLTADEAKHILGAQANLWTEYIASNEYAEYMVLPRMSALSEVVWSPKKKRNWEKFQDKLPKLYATYEYLDANYHIPIPGGLYNKVVYTDKAVIEFRKPLKGTEIRYTLDGSEPDNNSKLYNGAFEVSEDLTIKAATFMQSGKKSQIRVITTEKQKLFEAVELQNPVNGVKVNHYKGTFSKVDDIKGQPLRTEVISNFNINDDDGEDYFAAVFESYLKVPKDGIYAIQTGSDDGSVVYIDGEKVVDNDGLHGYQKRYGQIALAKGFHKMTVKYFEQSGGNYLRVYIKMPGDKMKYIPNENLFIN